MNSFSVIARLGKNAELRALPNGTPVVQFSAAFDAGYGDNATTTWLQCAVFGKRATEKLAANLLKGQKVGLTGEIKLDEWQGQNGTINKTLKMAVHDLTFAGSQPLGQQAAPQQTPPTPQPQQAQGFNDFDDDIPF